MPQPRRRFRLAVAIAIATAIAALGLMLGVAPRASAQYDVDCANPTQTFDETNMPTSLNLDAGDVVVFASGTFTGSVNTNGATICVASPAVFAPANINGTASVFVRGQADFPALAAGSGASLDNEGTVTFAPQPNVNGLADVINRAGASIVLNSSVALGSGVTVTNDGTLQVNGDVNFNGQLTNNETLTISGVLVLDGTVTNTALMTVGGQTTINANGTLVNTCRYVSDGMINNNTISNAGVIDLGTGSFVNNGAADVTQTDSGIALGGGFTNNGSVAGAGQYLFGGATSNQGSFVGDDPDVPIIFFDETPTGDQLFDVELGTIANAIREPVTPPDPDACAVAPPGTTTTQSTTSSTSSTSTTSLPTTSTTSSSSTTQPDGSTTSASTTTTTAIPTSTTIAGASGNGGRPGSGGSGGSTGSIGGGGGAGGGTLPATGAPSTGASVAAGLLLAVTGAALVYAARVRRAG